MDKAFFSVRCANHFQHVLVLLPRRKDTFLFAFFCFVVGNQIVVDLLLRDVCTVLYTVL